MTRAQEIIRALGLQRHPEGGWFAETWRSRDAIPAATLGARFEGARACSTAIYYLLERGDFSALHRLRAEEVWHFYKGDPVALTRITPGGAREMDWLGVDIEHDERPQWIVPAGQWQCAWSEGHHGWSLVGCTMAPGFDFADFELGRREALVRQFPQHAEFITKLTRG